MIGPELQKAIFTVLHPVAEGRIYDTPPAGATFPYVTIGDEQDIDDGSACGAAWEAFADVHFWSRSSAGSKVELKQLMQQATPLLVAISVTGFRVVVANAQNSRAFTDPDGLTQHGVLTVRYLIDPA